MRFPKHFRLLAAAGHITGAAILCLIGGCGGAGNTPPAPDLSSSAAPAAPDSAAQPSGGFAPAEDDTPELNAAASDDTQLVASEINWIQNFAEAKSQAASEGKDILMDFTGSDWCQWCVQLKEEVFTKAEFAEYAKENFVLLELDYPQDDSKMSPEIVTQNAELLDRLNSEQEFPTILLADPKGRPYAKTGYQPGGVTGYVQHLKELKATRVARDEAIAAAEQLEGVERAKKLDEVLSRIAPPLILPSYEAEVTQIISLDEANVAGLRQRYEQFRDGYERRRTAMRFQQRMAQVQNFANESQAKGDDIQKIVEALLVKLDEVEGEFPDYIDGRVSLTRIRIQVLGNDGRLDEAVKLADVALADEEIQGEGRRAVLISKLGALEMSNRLEDGIGVIDTIAAEFPDNPDLSTRLLLTKVNYLAKLERLEEGREALDAARKLASSELMPEVDALEKQLFSQPAAGDEGQASPASETGTSDGSDSEGEPAGQADATKENATKESGTGDEAPKKDDSGEDTSSADSDDQR